MHCSHIWNTVSHEAAHTLGLSHDGQGAESLYQGHGNWGPIMGAPWNKNVTQFSRLVSPLPVETAFGWGPGPSGQRLSIALTTLHAVTSLPQVQAV